jgi:hypothetical protein
LLIDKRADIIRGLAEGLNVDTLRVEAERIEDSIKLIDDPSDILYSEKSETIVSYRQKVMEIEADKDDFLFSLAGIKGETMDSLQRKTLSEIMSFAERAVKNG